MANKNTIYTSKSELDQFYTNPDIAKLCYKELTKRYRLRKFSLLLEPSAGDGSFYNLFPEDIRLGLDLEPNCSGIKKQDFFTFTPTQVGKIATIGNPPFGKNANLAIKFFNAAAKFSNVIAFIVPKTFQKQSVHNKLSLDFKLVLNTDLPKNSFLLNGSSYDVPCCFQIWEKTKQPRKKIIISLDNTLFTFTDRAHADLAVIRVGGRAGKATTVVANSNLNSHYFLAAKDKNKINYITDKINNTGFEMINFTAGVKSLSKQELIKTLFGNDE